MPKVVVKELLKESRVGHTVGIRGIFGLQRTFHVEVEKDPVYNKGYRPEFLMQDRRELGKSAVVAGSEYPEQPGFIAATFRIIKVLNALNFKVRVNYEPDSLIARPISLADLWQKEIDFGLEMEEAFFDLDGKPYGVPFYGESVERDLVGPENLKYASEIEPGRVIRLKRPTEFVSAWAQRRAEAGSGYQVSDGERKIPVKGESRQRSKKVGTLRMTRDFEVLDDTKRSWSFEAVEYINDASFVGADRGALRLDSVTSRDPRVGMDVNSRTPFDPTKAEQQRETITLNFSWNPRGWQPETQVHTWEDGKGNRAPIFDINEIPPVRQETQYRDYDYGDFESLLRLFD